MIEKSKVSVLAGAAGEFSSPKSAFCAGSYFGIRSTPALSQKHVKDPGHSAKSAGHVTAKYTRTQYNLWLPVQ